MGFVASSTTVTLQAKLTPYGRKKLIEGSADMVEKFALADSDANYKTNLLLDSGEIPSVSGTKTSSAANNNSVFRDFELTPKIPVDRSNNLFKSIDDDSSTMSTSISNLGMLTVTSPDLDQYTVTRTGLTTDDHVNWFKSFSLPITDREKALYNNTTLSNGGYSDSAISYLNQDDIIVISVHNDQFGELLDGKTIRTYVNTPSGSYTLYGTYANTLTGRERKDSQYREESNIARSFRDDVVFLFSDQIQRPNNDASLSWSTGYGNFKPFSSHDKKLFNIQDNSNLNVVRDQAVGVAYLNKGIIVITDPTINSDFDITAPEADDTEVEFDSVNNSMSYKYICIAGRNEFTRSSNSTYSRADTIRISSIGLYDNQDNLVATAKLDRHLEKVPERYMVFGVNLTI